MSPHMRTFSATGTQPRTAVPHESTTPVHLLYPRTPNLRSGTRLVIQLQRELNLPRIVRGIARRRDPAKSVWNRKVERVGGRDYVAAAESGRIEVGMVENVEELGAELEVNLFLDREILKGREVDSVESRSLKLCGMAAESSGACKGDAPRR